MQSCSQVRTRRKSSIKDEQELDIEVSIAALQGSSFSVQNGMSFSLLDTPGPNEAGQLSNRDFQPAVLLQLQFILCICIGLYETPWGPLRSLFLDRIRLVCLTAGEEKLKHAVERLLDGIDAVIYVLDFTKLKTSSEAS